MNARVSAKARTKARKVLSVIGVAAALAVGTSAAFAESHGGGGGGHFSGGGHVSAPHFSGGGHSFAAPHYSAGLHSYGAGSHAQIRAGGALVRRLAVPAGIAKPGRPGKRQDVEIEIAGRVRAARII